MRCKVTHLDTDQTTTYELSRDHWRRAEITRGGGVWACMRGDSVVMWLPTSRASAGTIFVTSGRRWEVID